MSTNAPWQGIGFTFMIVIALAPLLTRTRLSYAEQMSEADGIHALIPPLPDWLTFAGQLEIETTRQQNFNLIPPKNDTQTTIRPELELGTLVQPWEPVEVVLVIDIAHEKAIQDDTEEEEPDDLIFELKEAYVRFKRYRD